MRTKTRAKLLGEVFTPSDLVNEILDQLPAIVKDCWTDPTKTFLDPACGTGAFLVEIKHKLLKYNHTCDNILSRLYGVDIMKDNCIDTIINLYGPGDIQLISGNDISDKFYRPGLIAMFIHNKKIIETIVQADGTKYDYSFGIKTLPDELDSNLWTVN